MITVDLPGARPDGLRVTCLGDVLVVDGMAGVTAGCSPARAAVERFHVAERSTGPFRRVVRWPGPVDRSHGEASLRDGVLTISLTRALR